VAVLAIEATARKQPTEKTSKSKGGGTRNCRPRRRNAEASTPNKPNPEIARSRPPPFRDQPCSWRRLGDRRFPLAGKSSVSGVVPRDSCMMDVVVMVRSAVPAARTSLADAFERRLQRTASTQVGRGRTSAFSRLIKPRPLVRPGKPTYVSLSRLITTPVSGLESLTYVTLSRLITDARFRLES